MKNLLLLLALFSFVSLLDIISAKNKTGEIDKLVKSYYNTERFMGSVLAAENGRVIYRNAVGYANVEWEIPNSPEGVFKIASITKTFVSVITMQLVQEGKLRLDNRISDFLPYYRKDIGEKITVHQLLTHSSGIPNYLGLPGFMPDKIREPLKSPEDFIKKYCSNDLEFDPGSQFRYNNSGFAILGAIIEKVTGMSFEDALKRRILDPLGMKNTGMDKADLLLPNRVSGYTRNYDGSFQPAAYWDISTAYTAGQMYSTLDDMLKYHEGLLGEKLLKKQYKDLMFTKYYPAFGGYYGYGFMLRDLEQANGKPPLKIISHEGGITGFNLFFASIPEKNQVVVLLNNTGNAPLREMSVNILSLLNDMKYTLAVKSIARELYKKINTEGIEQALKFYDNAAKTEKGKYDFSEPELNSLGYQMLTINKLNEAISVFEKNVQQFPGSGNAFDSLAEGFMIKGDKENAVKFYNKSLELDPKNDNAREKLVILQK